MTKLITIDSKKQKQSKQLKDDLLKGLNALPENIASMVIAFRNDKGEVRTGFFNTNFVDEAVLLKALDMDIIRRQEARDMEWLDEDIDDDWRE